MSSKQGFFNQLHRSFSVRQNVIYLSLILFLGATLRLYNLGTESFWFDEIITVYRVPQNLQTLVHQITTQRQITRNAVYYLLAHFWVLPFELTEVSIRLLSAVFGVLSIGMMYLVGRQLFGERVALISSFFMAVSEFQIHYSQEARFYSLFVLFTLISLYCYILALRTKQSRHWILNLLINILLFYTHTYAIFIFAAEYAHYFIYWKNNKSTFVRWSVSQMFLILAVIIGLIPLPGGGSVSDMGGGLAWITRPSLKDLLRIIYDYLFPQNYQHDWLFIGVSFVAGFVFFIAGAFYYNYRKTKGHWLAELRGWFQNTQFLLHVDSKFVLVAVWFIFPIILPFIYSNTFSPILTDRYTICAAPAFYLLVAITISRISRVVPIYVSLCALMIVILPGLQDYYVADINEQWREVAAYVRENSQPNDVIVFAPDEEGYQSKSFDWYYRGALPSCGISSNITSEQAIASSLSSCTLGHGRFWVIIRGPSEVVNRFKSFFLIPDQTAAHLIKEQRFIQITAYLFELKK